MMTERPEDFGIDESDLSAIVRNVFDDQWLQFALTSSATVEPFSQHRAGYLGDHYILKLSIRRQDCKQNEYLELFFKILPKKIPALTDYLTAIGTCRKECKLYSDLIPMMSRFTRFAPKCFLVKCDQLVVLENLKLNGFRSIANANTGLFDMNHLKCALVALAKFHCASLLVESETGRNLQDLSHHALDENAWIRRDDNPRVEELDNAIQVLIELVKVIEKHNERLEEIIRKIPGFMLQIYDLVKPSSVYENVACHGDLWGSNVMFRYAEHDDRTPVECMIVDFQFTRYAPPAYDLNMIITLTTTGAFRRQYRDELINFYYQTLRQEIISQWLSPEEIFPRAQFFDSCERYRISGLIDNFLMNHVTLLPRSCVDQVFSSPQNYNHFSGESKTKLCLNVLETDSVYKERISGIIRDLIEAL